MTARYFFSALSILLIFGIQAITQTASLSGGSPSDPTPEKEIVQANFMVEDTLIYAGRPVAFTDLSSGSPTFHRWDFEGATPAISYATNPIIQYSYTGHYNVQLIVTGLNGSDTLLRENYVRVVSEQSGLPPGWEYNPSISQHTLIVKEESDPRIFQVPIQPGDYVGVFYEDDNAELKCAGAVEWTGSGNTAIIAQGDNFFTTEKDGFAAGEAFTWKLYSWDMQEEFIAEAGYDPEMPISMFVPNGISIVTDLSAGSVTPVFFAEGWSGVSSHILPWFGDFDQLFAEHLDDIEIIYDGTGIFRPDHNQNSIGNWKNQGYMVKMKNEVTLDFAGYPVQDNLVEIETGWNIINVPVECGVEITTLLQANISKTTIIREIAGQNLFWPGYNIQTLQQLMPGKAYQLLATDDFIISFPDCD